jgi:hypothetical protein
MSRYRHTQFGWAIVTSLLLPVAILGTVALTSHSLAPLLGLIPLVVILPLFAAMTVDVSDDAVSLRFGMGIIHKRWRLAEIASIAPVTNSWSCGWGIRLIPGGWLYNVSGTQGVELVLRNGRKVRIGTDDQAGLIAALREAQATVLPETAPEPSGMLGYTMAGPIIVVVIVSIGMALVLTLASGPIEVVTSPAAVSIHGSGYIARIPTSDIISVHLDDQLPSIRWRTNGLGFRGRLRGHFKLSDGRAAQLFVTRAHPPFITVETRTTPVILNFDDPDRTRALYEQLAATF